ncbi:MAG: arginase family protein [Ardenticatenaceae bacterium]|nr:arginase family protein [Ardenticatenaceae bacterium]
MATKSLDAVQVIGIRYRRTELAERDERSLDAYKTAGVYEQAGVPFTVVEPKIYEDERVEDEPLNLGVLGGRVAEEAAEARRQGKGVLMTGGDCTHITGVVGGLQDAHGSEARIGLVWFDAHGDFNTPNTTLSGMLGGMPVSVCAGLSFPQWREGSHIAAPLPTDRILMVDVRNLDVPEEQLIRATAVRIARVAEGFNGDVDLETAVTQLAHRCDYIYLHIDSDILDESYVPNHGTKEPDGPSMDQVAAAIETVMATGKVAALAVVSVYGEGEGSEVAVASGIELIQAGLKSWRRHGVPA